MAVSGTGGGGTGGGGRGKGRAGGGGRGSGAGPGFGPGFGPGVGRGAGKGSETGEKGASGRGARDLRVRVKTAKGRKLSSTRWLDRQLNDPYVRAAQREGYRSRAAFKLIEIDDKHRLLKPGQRVVDLGAAPGGWAQVAVARVNALGARPGLARGTVLAVDLQEVAPIAGVELMMLDFLEEGADAAVRAALAGPADIVLSDMAPFSSGHRQTDHLRIVALCEAAAIFARETLAPGGVFVAKVLQGGADGELLTALKRDFVRVVHIKPPASRSDSAEQYLVATGFRGGAHEPDPSGAPGREGR